MVKYLYYKTHRRATPMTNNSHRRWLLESLKVVYQKSLSKKSSLFDCHIVYILPIQLTICVRSLNTWRVTKLHITPIQTITCILYNMFPLFLASRTYKNMISPIETVIKKWTSEIFRVQNSQNSKIRNFVTFVEFEVVWSFFAFIGHCRLFHQSDIYQSRVF